MSSRIQPLIAGNISTIGWSILNLLVYRNPQKEKKVNQKAKIPLKSRKYWNEPNQQSQLLSSVMVGYTLASERANSNHVTSARASPHTITTLNATPPSLLSSLAAAHHFSSISHIFSTSALPSPCLKPPDNTSWTTQNSTADTTRACLVESPVSSDTHVACDTLLFGEPG